MILAWLVSIAWAVELPPRPVQSAELAPGDCPETAIIDGVPDPALPSCTGLVLGLQTWADLEKLAADSGHVRQLWQLQAAEHRMELAVLQARVDALEQPRPWVQRHGALVGASGALLAVILWEAATREIIR